MSEHEPNKNYVTRELRPVSEVEKRFGDMAEARERKWQRATPISRHPTELGWGWGILGIVFWGGVAYAIYHFFPMMSVLKTALLF